ncbi:hypothetical protein D3C75_456920 [compost metagenome]
MTGFTPPDAAALKRILSTRMPYVSSFQSTPVTALNLAQFCPLARLAPMLILVSLSEPIAIGCGEVYTLEPPSVTLTDATWAKRSRLRVADSLVSRGTPVSAAMDVPVAGALAAFMLPA